MPRIQPAEVNYSITHSCFDGAGRVSVYNVNTGPGVSLGFTVVHVESGITVGAYSFGAGSSGDSITFDNIPDGNVEVQVLATGTSFSDVHEYQIACGTELELCDIELTIEQTNETNDGANNGTITASANSSAGGFEYSLNGSPYQTIGLFTQLEPGIYTVSAKDANECIDTATVEILRGKICDIVLDRVEVVGNAAIVHARSSFLPLEYSFDAEVTWQPENQISCLKNGTYSVTVRDAQGCIADSDFEISDMYGPGYFGAHALFYLVIAGVWHSILEPKKWDGIEQEINRDQKTHGVIFATSKQQLFFDCDSGADLIREQYTLFGIDAEIGFVSLVRDCSECIYQEDYFGSLNMADYNYDPIKNRVSCNIEEKSLSITISNRAKTKIDLTQALGLDDKETDAVGPTSIQLHSKPIIKNYYATADETESSYQVTAAMVQSTPPAATRSPTIVLGFNKVVTNELESFYQYLTGFSGSGSKAEFFEAVENGDFELEFYFKAFISVVLMKGDFEEVEITFYYQKNNDAPEYLCGIYDSGVNGSFYSGNYGDALEAYRKENLSLVIGDKLKIYGEIAVTDVSGSYHFVYKIFLTPDSFVRVKALTTVSAQMADGFLLHEAGAKIASSITGRKNSFRSEFLGRTDSLPRAYAADGCGSKNIVMPGYWVRGLVRPFPLSLAEFYDNIDAIYCAGLGVEKEAGKEVIVLERVPYFYKDLELMRFNSVIGFKQTAAPDYVYNAVNLGYEESTFKNDQINGLDAICTRREWQTPIKQHQGEYKKLCTWVAEGYSWEIIRRVGKASDDTSRDDKTFITNAKRGVNFWTAAKDEDFETIANLLSPATTYNQKITPARIFRHHAPIVNSGVWQYPDGVYKSTYGVANIDLESKLNAEAECSIGDPERRQIKESANIPIAENDEGQRLFNPDYFEFSVEMDRETFRSVKLNPYLYLALWNGIEWVSGWVLNAKYKGRKKLCKFKLISRFGYIENSGGAPGSPDLIEHNIAEYNEAEHN